MEICIYRQKLLNVNFISLNSNWSYTNENERKHFDQRYQVTFLGMAGNDVVVDINNPKQGSGPSLVLGTGILLLHAVNMNSTKLWELTIENTIVFG